MDRVLEWLLRLWSAALVLSALLWLPMLQSSGSSWIPDRIHHFLVFQFGPTDGVYTGVRMGAYFTDDTLARIQAGMPDDLMLSADQADQANPLGSRNQGDVIVGWSLQFFPEDEQDLLHTMLHLIPLLVMAVLVWWLAGAVAQSRHEQVFTLANARRLTIAGAVVALGGPLLALGTWLLHRWVLETSQFADRAEIPAFGLGSIPWGTVAAGLALIVLGTVWRKGTRKEHDLAGLV